jgi:hypothetical protein
MAADLLTSGNPRAAVAAILQRDCSVSRATAYRLIRQAELTLPVEYHQPSNLAGMIDTLSEAQRHYEAALLAGDDTAVTRWFDRVHRCQLDVNRTHPFDVSEINRSRESVPWDDID